MRAKSIALCLLLLGPIVPLGAQVTVDFAHSYTGAPAATQNTGTITLDFSVNGSGQVSLDASCSDPDPAAYVNEFDGAAGSLSDSAFWNSTFQVTIDGTGNLRIDNNGLGLAIQGSNAQRLDAANEAITFSMVTGSLQLAVASVDYGNSNGTFLDFNGTAYAIGSGTGQVDVSGEAPSISCQIDSSSDGDSAGFVITGITFEIVPVGPDSMEVGTDILQPAEVLMQGSNDTFVFTGTDAGSLYVGKAATFVTAPSATGASPVAIGQAQLVIEEGARWILDGSQYTGSFAIGEQFVLSTFGSFSGLLSGIRHRNFALPSNRNLKLFQTSTSLYYEVVNQTPVSGPNIILVYMDDMSAGHHFGFEGKDVLTPVIDSLAANGISFTNAIASTSVCSPSRYSLLTSRWPSRNPSPAFMQRFPSGNLARFENTGSELPLDKDNIAGWLQSLGYRTGFVGKSHIIHHELWNPANWPAGGLLTYATDADPAADAGVNAAMQFNHRVIAQRHQPRGFDFAGGVYLGNLREQYNDFLNRHNQEWLTQYARQFIEENHDQPFFLYMAPTINHGPIRPDLSYSLNADPRYTGEGFIANPDFSFMPTRAAIINEVTSAGKNLPTARETWVDYSMAAIMAKLTEHGLLDDTLIIFTSDHGWETLRDSPQLSGKSSLYDAGLEVPLVMHWPSGITVPGSQYAGLVQNVDIAATLLALNWAPALPDDPIDGVSLESVLTGSSAEVRSEAYSEIGYARSIRTADWKFISLRYPDSVQQLIEQGYLWEERDTGEFILPRPYYITNTGLADAPSDDFPGYFDDNQLYDLNADPHEQNNIFGDNPAMQVYLKKRLSEYSGVIAGRPFGEFAPIATVAPAAPTSYAWSIPAAQTLSLSWTDAASNELGYFVTQSVEGSPDVIIAELPVDSSGLSLYLPDYGDEDTIQVTAYNAIGESSASAPLDLVEPEIWRYRTFYDIDPSLSNPVSSWDGDPDEDRISNLLEYAFSMNPLAAESLSWPLLQLVTIGSASYMEIPVPWDGRRMVDITGYWSTDLANWIQGEPNVTLLQEAGQYLLRSNVSMQDGARQFLTIDISLP